MALSITGIDPLPSDETIDAFEQYQAYDDPIAAHFVREVYHGAIGAERGCELVARASRDGIDAIGDAPPAMVELFREFESIPDWVDRESVERGAEVWRRWGYDMGSMANAGTMDMYTEGWLAVPLALAGGYVGKGALHRHLETSRWWLECARPGAVFELGSQARQISLHVRIMHVSVRHGVTQAADWESERWGPPLNQSEQLLTLIAGSVVPALGLYAVGYLTSPTETRDCLHFCRYLGHLLGVDVGELYPTTIGDALRLLYYVDATRRYDSGRHGIAVTESIVPSFGIADPNLPRRSRLRRRWEMHLQSGYTRLFMLPWNRRRYRIPASWPGVLYLFARAPFIAAIDLARRLSPAVDRWQQARSMSSWEAWIDDMAGGRAAVFAPVTINPTDNTPTEGPDD